jgi:hypothetical protein
MRKLIVVSTLALGVIVAACEQAADTPTAPPQQQPSTSSGPAVATAQGGGKATTAGGSTYHFAFSAAVDNDGSPKGNAMLRIGDTRYNADVVCLGVRGDTAVIVGVVRSSSDPSAVGDSLVFTAIDGSDRIGEPEFPASGTAGDVTVNLVANPPGAGAGAGAGARCASVTPGATRAVDAGQVKVSGTTFTGPVIVGTVVGMGTSTASNGLYATNIQTNVTRLSDGTVSGEYRQEYTQLGQVLVLTVTCVTFSGDTAYLGGLYSVNGGPPAGESGVIVVDNAPSTNPDQVTEFIEGTAQDICNGAVSEPLNDLTSGDIAITP